MLTTAQLYALSAQDYTSAAYEASAKVYGGPCILLGFAGYSSAASAQWIHVYDAVALPPAGTIPKLILVAGATSNFGYARSFPGMLFEKGIYIGNSSTGPTKTIGSADTWFEVSYLR